MSGDRRKLQSAHRHVDRAPRRGRWCSGRPTRSRLCLERTRIDPLGRANERWRAFVRLAWLAFFIFLVNPVYMEPLYKEAIGWAMLAGACFMEFVGVMIIKKIITIEV